MLRFTSYIALRFITSSFLLAFTAASASRHRVPHSTHWWSSRRSTPCRTLVQSGDWACTDDAIKVALTDADPTGIYRMAGEQASLDGRPRGDGFVSCTPARKSLRA